MHPVLDVFRSLERRDNASHFRDSANEQTVRVVSLFLAADRACRTLLKISRPIDGPNFMASAGGPELASRLTLNEPSWGGSGGAWMGCGCAGGPDEIHRHGRAAFALWRCEQVCSFKGRNERGGRAKSFELGLGSAALA